MKYKIKEIWLDPNPDRAKYPYWTGLTLITEEGQAIDQFSTDVIIQWGDPQPTHE